ncbi:MAG: alpha/beta fold hydrolase [Myxococcales bacterium]|nr:alpha/beta fold hydrolase [Myxococcales bacterium]
MGSRWLNEGCLSAQGARLFCLPYAGGGASIYRTWAERLDRTAVVPVRLPGREHRIGERAIGDWRQLVGKLVEALEPHLAQDYALFGHSMGGLIAFELAREIRRRGLPEPGVLFVSGHRAPDLPMREARWGGLEDEEFTRRLGQDFEVPAEVIGNKALMRYLLPTFRADFAICEEYEHEPDEPLDCDLVVLGGAKDPQTTTAELQGWSSQARSCHVEIVDGDHYFVDARSDAVLEIVRRAMQGACAEGSSEASLQGAV